MARNKKIVTKIGKVKVIFEAGCFDMDDISEEEAKSIAEQVIRKDKPELIHDDKTEYMENN